MNFKLLTFFLVLFTSLYGGNWAVQDCNGKNQLTLEPSGDFNISVGNLQLPEGNFSVMKGNGKIKGNFDVGGDLKIGGKMLVDAPLPHLDINSTTVTEGDDAVLSIRLLDRDNNLVDADNDIEIHYKTMNGGAIAGQDFDGVSDKTVTLKSGDNSVNITISTTDDSDNEYNRTETAFVKIWLEGDNHDYANACCASMGIIGITDNDDDGSGSSSGGGSSDDDDDDDDGGSSWF